MVRQPGEKSLDGSSIEPVIVESLWGDMSNSGHLLGGMMIMDTLPWLKRRSLCQIMVNN